MLNPGSFPLEIIEIRTGSYLFEDDNYHVEN
ncbi:mannose-6-phosphate isomerase family protein, partial [Escherichia coli p0305293.6]